MINNQKCDTCVFQVKCVAHTKLKPFSEEARTDLGVELDFVSCAEYQEIKEDED